MVCISLFHLPLPIINYLMLAMPFSTYGHRVNESARYATNREIDGVLNVPEHSQQKRCTLAPLTTISHNLR